MNNGEILTALYRSKVVAFAERAMTVLEPRTKLETNWHDRAICHKLELASQEIGLARPICLKKGDLLEAEHLSRAVLD